MDSMAQDILNAAILVVDDNPTNLRVFLEQLEQAGFRTLVAPSGERALKQIERLQPDLILLDVLMPGIDGFETCVRLKENAHTRDIPVIFMTALSDTVDKVKGFEVGGVDYITKPFHTEEVIARITTHLTIRRLQQQLQQQNEELRALNANKDKFLSVISHDLRSPFSSLRGLIQFTTANIDGWDKDQIDKILGLLTNSTDNLYALIENLLTWSRIQRGVIEHRPEQIDIQSIVANAVNLFQSMAEQKGIPLTNTVQDSIHAYADAHMIDAVMRNLLSNAVKFTHPGGGIEVGASEAEEQVTVFVKDSGIGLSEENQVKLFRIDQRYKQLGTAREKGTGMGLILCKEFIEKNNGIIWLESDLNTGSTFFFTLPASPPQNRRSMRPSPSAATASLRS